ncbi:MAG TPA: GNAT family N-acetyltransferase [Dehalococcoidia bacterium]|nr:GNAT family N-acetyltransferase [Dehalococcoidia bacterium]
MTEAALGPVSAALAEEWRALLGHAALRHVFLSPAWLRAWWEEFGQGSPTIVAARHGERLVGIAPFLRRGDVLTFAGDPNVCDYMDFVLARDVATEALGELWQSLLRLEWRELVLWGLSEESPTLALLPALARREGLTLLQEREDVCPALELPGTWEEYLESLPGKDRHELLRKLRRLYRVGEPSLEVLSSPEEATAAVDQFLHLHRISRPDKARFMTEEMARFFRRMVSYLSEEGWVRLYFLRLGQVRAAALLCFVAGDTLQLYNSGYDPDYSHLSVGLLSKAMLVEHAIAAGFRRLDFLRGAEPYKYDLGARDVGVHRLRLLRE